MLAKPTLYTRLMNEGHSLLRLSEFRRPATEAEIRVTREALAILPAIVSDLPKDKNPGRAYPFLPVILPFPKFWVEGIMRDENPRVLWGCMVETHQMFPNTFCAIAYLGSPDGLFYMGTSRTTMLDGVPGFEKQEGRIRENYNLRPGDDSLTRRHFGDSHSHSQIMVELNGVLALLAFRNVVIDEHPHDAKLSHRIRRHAPFATAYHTIHIRMGARKSKTPSQTIGEAIGSMPLHKCRGHRAYYGPKYGRGLLFGKYEGCFIIPPCLKGNTKNGVVDGHYVVSA